MIPRQTPVWLNADPAAPFPPLEDALRDPDGLLAVGGDLSVTRLRNAYASGVFPWFSDGQPILWWSPDPRMVLFPDELHVGRSLRKTIRRAQRDESFEISHDRAFDEVIAACSTIPREGQDGTWITDDMLAAYREFHRSGFAHSVEAWRDGELVGGLYGVAIGRVFFGESMFAREPDASKIAFASFVEELADAGYAVIDCQVHTDHLARFGARLIERKQFAEILAQACDQTPDRLVFEK